ncbi:MAG: hypothetical protein H6566_15735 [Lewinellaceae bacterium]|nr:hypothetical protein [Lewinellaceae bacterium]
MIAQQVISIDAPAEWKEALNNIKHSFGHTWENCYAMQLTTGFKTYLYCLKSEHGHIFCPISERKYGSYIDILKPFGFCGFVRTGDGDNFLPYWEAFVKKKGYVCGYLGLDPIFNSGDYFNPEDIYQYDTVHVLDLTIPVDELFANLSENRKRQLRNWDRGLSDFVFDRARLIDFFLSNYLDFFQRINASSYYHFSRETISYLFGLENVILVGAQDKEGNLAAISVFTYTPHVGEYLFNVSLPEGRQFAVPLIWHGINRLKSLGIPLLNLGGGKHNLFEFKRRFGGRQYALQGLKQVYKPEIYQRLCQQANTDPNDRTGYFPAYRKP